MTTIYKFQDSETALTSPASDDQLVVYDASAFATKKIAFGLAGATAATAATSATTGTNLSAYGISTITSSNEGLNYLIDAPVSAGIRKIVVCATTCGAVLKPTPAVVCCLGSSAIATITFNGVKWPHVELVSLSTASWLYASSSSTLYAALS